MKKNLPTKTGFPSEVFSGWKEIAAYLGKGVRTVQRYERIMALPIRRPAGRLSGAVIATKPELEAWLAASPLRGAFHITQNTANFEPLRQEFRKNLDELSRLRSETRELREQLSESLELLRTNLRLVLVERRSQFVRASSNRRSIAFRFEENPLNQRLNSADAWRGLGAHRFELLRVR